jgi:hypothetical protein
MGLRRVAWGCETMNSSKALLICFLLQNYNFNHYYINVCS